MSQLITPALMSPAVVLSLCAAIFCTGLAGLLVRRNILVLIMSIELMLNSANLTIVTFAQLRNDLAGEMTVFFVMVVAAVESAVGLSLVIALFRNLRTVDTDQLTELKG